MADNWQGRAKEVVNWKKNSLYLLYPSSAAPFYPP